MWSNPLWNNNQTIIAAIDDMSIIPIGGITFLNGCKKGSYKNKKK